MFDIVVRNRAEAQHYWTERNHAIVSITDPKSESVTFPGQYATDIKNRFGIHRTQFFDSDIRHAKFFDKYPPMTEVQATEIWLFVQSVEKEIEELLVHCEAGVSRSASVAAAISRYLGENDDDWFKFYIPNRYVYRTLIRTMPLR